MLHSKTLPSISVSSPIEKGTHIGVEHLRRMIRKASCNGTRPCYALKMDIRRFFDSVDHSILKRFLRNSIKDENVLTITDTIIDSFRVSAGPCESIGIPLGNVTSQLFANVYLHELDRFVKHELKEKYYVRYCDDWAPRRNVNNISGFIEDEGRSLEVDLQGLASNRLVTNDSKWGLREANKEKAA